MKVCIFFVFVVVVDGGGIDIIAAAEKCLDKYAFMSWKELMKAHK